MSLLMKLTQSWRDDADAVRDAVIDNICALIASRAPLWGKDDDSLLAQNTIVSLGIRSTARSQSKANREVIRDDIQTLIRAFEPRLHDVDITMQDADEKHNQLRLRIAGVIHSSFGDESVVLDSRLDLASNKLDVRKSSLV
ncbi:type VI secretion system baseplate subunit TssE [Veronia pacifica]|uniref:Type VI secretion protein n=1 Tax=Veronia pacifica TaxID=1080227 RepID=A0A1C3EDQ5_9GAMM|nr:type VI secretion system baseplate subunit TssE [Veronia pacifica]ODA31365.1 type VI secretion protein [Veronia pacifica]